MKRFLATAATAILMGILLTNCTKENLQPTTPASTPELMEVTYRGLNNQPRPGANIRPATIIIDPLPFLEIKIRKTACFAGGNTIEVLAPGYGDDFLKSARFRIDWAVDGLRMGNEVRLECIRGKLAEVTVTFLRTGQKFRATAVLDTNPAGGDR